MILLSGGSVLLHSGPDVPAFGAPRSGVQIEQRMRHCEIVEFVQINAPDCSVASAVFLGCVHCRKSFHGDSGAILDFISRI